jgi:DNA-binding winged helix-turn-helix (wHTH) protein
MPLLTFADLSLETTTGEMLVSGVLVGNFPPSLSNVMVALIRAKGRVVTNHQLLDALWGASDDAPDRLAVPIHRIRKVLRRINSRITVVSVYGVGYRLHHGPT